MLRVVFYLSAIVLAGLANFSKNQDVYGGAAYTCNVDPTPSLCSGSYIGSTGCGAFSVNTNGWGTQTKLAAQTSVGNCNTNLDSANVTCAGLANVSVLNAAACDSNVPWVPFW